ncbi:MAG: hypothetical protein ACT4PP_14000 [Sporichthyaceae bacterium]
MRNWKKSILGGAVAAASLIAPMPPLAAVDSSAAEFDLKALTSGKYREIQSPIGQLGVPAVDAQGLQLLYTSGKQVVLADTSLYGSGVVSAVSTRSINLSWKLQDDVLGYSVYRDDTKIADLESGVSKFRDSSTEAGMSHRYIVAPVVDANSAVTRRVWSMIATKPRKTPRESDIDALMRQAATQTRLAAAASTTTLSWISFIPQARIDVPSSVGGSLCTYGDGKHQFGGDNRGFNWSQSGHRTATHATITWSNKSVVGNISVSPTNVYRKSDGRLIATRQASASRMQAFKQGGSGDRVDIRMVHKASNPFCNVGSIDGAASFEITQSGNYTIRSGSHRQMPNHMIYIFNGGRVTYVHQIVAKGPACLVGGACEVYHLNGIRGSYS